MTTQLIPVFTRNLHDDSVQLCNARDLHTALQVGKVFAAWITERIAAYGFVENEDFVVFSESGKNPKGGRPSKDYHITLDMAKELAMVENNDMGRKVRRYFIQVEREAKQAAAMLKTIDPSQQSVLQSIVEDRFPDGGDRIHAWRRFNRHFMLGSYKQLPAELMPEAIDFLQDLPSPYDFEPAVELLAEQRLRSARFCLRFDEQGRMTLRELTPDVFMLTADQIPELVADPFMLSDEKAAGIAHAALDRLVPKVNGGRDGK